jgi:hypothetical protein
MELLAGPDGAGEPRSCYGWKSELT